MEGRWPEKTALKFERDKSHQVTIQADPAFCLAGDVSIAVWIRCPDAIKGGHIISNRRLYDVNYQFGWLGENPPGSDLPERPKRMEYCRYKEEAKTGGRKQPEQSLLVSQEWVQLVVTHDNYEVRFYANGRLFDIQPYVTNKPVVIADLVIGAMPEELNNDFYYCRFNGVIDEVAIFRRILSEEEIRQMYEAGKPF